MERLTERVKGESFPVRGITYIEIVEQLAKYEDREEGIKVRGFVEIVYCEDCKHSVPEDGFRVFCGLKGRQKNKKSFCEAMEK